MVFSDEEMKKGHERAKSRREERQANGLSAYRNPIEKAQENPTSLRAAINGKCYDCIGQDGDPDWRGSIRECVCTDCTLYPVRPYQ